MIDFNTIASNERQKNILMILDHIAGKEETSATDIVEATGLSLATISRGIAALKKARVVKSLGKEHTEMGRRPAILGINPGYGLLLHFFVGDGGIRAYMSDFCGKLLGSVEAEADGDITPAEFSEKLARCTERLAAEHKLDASRILAAGVSVPGLVDEGAAVVRRIPNFVNFRNVNLKNYASSALDVPVIINNEARLSATGGHIHDFPNMKNLVYIDFTRYSGIGSGIIVNGALVDGRNGFAGEIGDILVDIHNFENGHSEDEGCLEAMAGVGVLYGRLEKLLARGRANILKETMLLEARERLDLALIERVVLMQDLDVMDVFDDTMKKWAIAVINICALLDPDIILLGGVVGKGNDVVLARIKHYVSRILDHDVNIELCDTDAYQLHGGIYMLKNYVFNHILPELLFPEE